MPNLSYLRWVISGSVLPWPCYLNYTFLSLKCTSVSIFLPPFPPNPSHPYFPSLILPLFGFVHVFYRCSWKLFPLFPPLSQLYLNNNTKKVKPWLVWLSGLSTGLQTKGLPVQIPVRVHAWVVGQVPSRGTWKATTPWYFSPSLLSLSFSLPSPLSKNK